MTGKRSRTAFETDLQKQESPYTFYGTPLPPLDEHTRDDGSFVPVWKQEVTDDRGRKRLHGAFTGGFSAGYFNTVGSKEGWTPSTFVSSRQSRQKDGPRAGQQRLEDFMDEEDLREAEEARNLHTSEGFEGFGSTAHDSMRIGGLMEVLRPSSETIGSRLLKKMGWKEGQGLGPRVRRRAYVGQGEFEPDETHLFAPQDSAMITFSRKTDQKGLGYQGESHLEQTSSKAKVDASRGQTSDVEDDHPTALKSKKPEVRSTGNRAFGIGVLNDTGSDDEDHFEMGPKISYSRVIGAEKKSRKKKKDVAQTIANPLVKTKPVSFLKKLSTQKPGFRRTRDGRLPLDGFVLADELDGFASISLLDDSMKPPVVPVDWRSIKSPARDTNSQAYTSVVDAARASSLDAKGRAALLGEKVLPGKSIFDFLSPASRNKLASASGKIDLPLAGSQPPPPGYESSNEAKEKRLHDLVPQLDPQVALQALSRGVGGWMPYAEDESKRDRYRSYLEVRAGLLDQLPAQAAGTTLEDWANEMTEFARAALVFKPVTGLMASRFTSSTGSPKSSHESGEGEAGEALLSKPASKPEDAAVAAARIGMFGPVTRTVTNFYPSRLVCKRFNVQPPESAVDPGSGPESNRASAGPPRPSPVHAYRSEAENGGSKTLTIKAAAHEPVTNDVHSIAAETERVGLAVGHEHGLNEALEKERPGQDVFRAIFGSDDDEEDDT